MRVSGRAGRTTGDVRRAVVRYQVDQKIKPVEKGFRKTSIVDVQRTAQSPGSRRLLPKLRRFTSRKGVRWLR